MFHNPFNGHRPSQLQINPLVKAFILSETFFWSGQNLLAPIFSVFVAQELTGGSLEAAGTAVTVYMIARILAELYIGRLLKNSTDTKKLWYAILGIIFVSACYLGMAVANTVEVVYLLQFIIGLGFGVISPAKYALFSEHLDKGKETSEWSIYDATVFGGMAFTAMLGGYIAQQNGFDTLFAISAMIMAIGAVPFYFLTSQKQSQINNLWYTTSSILVMGIALIAFAHIFLRDKRSSHDGRKRGSKNT